MEKGDGKKRAAFTKEKKSLLAYLVVQSTPAYEHSLLSCMCTSSFIYFSFSVRLLQGTTAGSFFSSLLCYRHHLRMPSDHPTSTNVGQQNSKKKGIHLSPWETKQSPVFCMSFLFTVLRLCVLLYRFLVLEIHHGAYSE